MVRRRALLGDLGLGDGVKVLCLEVIGVMGGGEAVEDGNCPAARNGLYFPNAATDPSLTDIERGTET